MPRAARLDVEMVRRGLARSRAEARAAIEQGLVNVKGMPASRAATLVRPDDPVTLRGEVRRFVSRGGDKLDRALARLEVAVAGRRWLDVGASTGGFTDRLLTDGAAAVVAVDVGYGQLDWTLRNDERVVVLERTNARDLDAAMLPFVPDASVADVSFISLTLVSARIVDVCVDDADHIWMVKPQFEAGPQQVGRGGVVRDPAVWEEAVTGVVSAAEEHGVGLVACVPSEVPGPAGNREFFVHLRRGANAGSAAIRAAVEEASAV